MYKAAIIAARAVPSWVWYSGAALAVVMIARSAIIKQPGQSIANHLSDQVANAVSTTIADVISGTVSGTVEGVAPKVAPWSDQNIIYKDIVGAIGRSTSGDKNWTLGGWIYDITH